MNNFDLNKLNNVEARRLFSVFTMYRQVNRDFFETVHEELYDFRMVENDYVRSDSVRESLAHMINVQRSYLFRCKNGVGDFHRGDFYNQDLKTLSKTALLEEHEQTFSDLYEFLCSEDDCSLNVEVPWSQNPITALRYLWGMNDHEIFHNGWNVAMMDHLNIKRFPSIVSLWG